MPTFLTQAQLYRVLQRELPEDVYADGAASAFYSTADMASVAKTLETAYSNLYRIYLNYFPQYADEKISDWEVMIFGLVSDASLTLQQRRDRILARLRTRRGITKQDMLDISLEVLGTDFTNDIEIAEWNNYTGVWMLGLSQLGIETILGSNGNVWGPALCSQDAADWGLTDEEWADLKEQAYTFQIRIYLHTLTDSQREALETALYYGEPARSNYVITDGLTNGQRLNPSDLGNNIVGEAVVGEAILG